MQYVIEQYNIKKFEGNYTYFSDQIDVSLSWTESIEIKTTNVIIISWSLD